MRLYWDSIEFRDTTPIVENDMDKNMENESAPWVM